MIPSIPHKNRLPFLTPGLEKPSVNYFRANRVLDLSTPFSELTFTLDDKSGEGNDATLYTGRYVSTDGSTDRGIVADCSAAGAGSYYLTGKVRPNAVTTAELTMDGSTDSGLTGLTADVWQTFTTATSAVTPSAVQVGYDGSTASAADWSDVRLIDSSDGSTVARWQLNESADGDLDGYTALDSSGNGYHGTHTGCAGGTGEGIDADVAGAAFAANEDKMYFDGVNDYVAVAGMTNSTSYFGACTISATVNVIDPSATQAVWALGGSSYRVVIISGLYYVNGSSTGISVPSGEHQISANYDETGTGVSFSINGVEVWTGGASSSFAGTVFYVGARNSAGAGIFFKGLIYDFAITGSSVKNFAYAGNELVTWTDTSGGGNNGTVNGNPVTVGQKRATILQTAGMDWNKAWTFDGDGSSYATYGSALIPAASDFSIVLYVLHRNGSTSSLKDIVSQYQGSEVGRFLLNVRNNNVRLFIGQSGGNVNVEGGSFTPNVIHKVEVTRVGDLFTLLVNDSEVGAATVAGSISVLNPTWIGESLASVSRNLDGFVAGYINGVPVGEFTAVGTTASNYLIPASDATPTNDALGNAIAEPRPTADTWNLFGDGEYGRVADADSLDLTTAATWEIWGNMYYNYSNEGILAKLNSWIIRKRSAQGVNNMQFWGYNSTGAPELLTLGGITAGTHCFHIVYDAGTVSFYEDGVLRDTDTFAAAPSLDVLATDITIGTQGSEYSTRQISRPKIYNRALTADEVLQNYNAQKGAFGL